MTIASGISASMASSTAALVPAAGTKITDTSAPVAAIVSATVANTGTSTPFSSTVVPAFLGFVPPTTWAPAASMRAPCLRPSPPVMPWIRILLSAVRKIAIFSCTLRGELGGALRGAVHGVHLLNHRDGGVDQDLAALGRLVAVKPDDDRLADRLAPLGEQLHRRDDTVGDRVAGGDAAEDVHEHRLDRRVGEHDLKAVGHHRRRGAAADVEEVGGLNAAERLTRVRHHVERGHDQARAVADDANLAVELDVVEVLLLGPGLKRVRRLDVGEPLVLLAEGGVVVDGDLAVEREHLAVRGEHDGVDLGEGRVLVGE